MRLYHNISYLHPCCHRHYSISFCCVTQLCGLYWYRLAISIPCMIHCRAHLSLPLMQCSSDGPCCQSACKPAADLPAFYRFLCCMRIRISQQCVYECVSMKLACHVRAADDRSIQFPTTIWRRMHCSGGRISVYCRLQSGPLFDWRGLTLITFIGI